MIRNDYKRALIMLRSLMNGYSGHARLEVRTLAGTLSALAGIPQGERSVYAALVGSHKGRYYAAPLGALRRDMRGQAVMTANFDPRDIGGRSLDQYSLLALVEVAGDKRDIAMVGNLNGNVDVDWGKVRDTAVALYGTQAQPVSELLSGGIEKESEVAPEELNFDFTPAPEVAPETIPEEPEDMTLPELPPVVEEPAEEAPPLQGEGWSFAKMPLIKGCGCKCAYIGVRSPGGAPDEICCAVPGQFAPEPPAGLDDYEWLGDSNEGWWLKCLEPVAGE